MTCRNYLAPPFLLLLELDDHFGKISHYGRMQRQLRLFKKYRPLSVKTRPQEADQPHGAIRKLVLPLMRTLGTPVAKGGLEMRPAELVRDQLESFELRHGDLECLADPPEVTAACGIVESGGPRDEVASERFALPAAKEGRKADYLWHEVEVANTRKEVHDLLEGFVADRLFEEGKGGEVFVIRIRARQAVVNQAGVPPDLLGFDNWPQLLYSPTLLVEDEFIFPTGSCRVLVRKLAGTPERLMDLVQRESGPWRPLRALLSRP